MTVATSSVETIPRVLVVGGTDPSGAAGVGRDVKTLEGLGVYAALAVTAVTVQTSRSVSDVVALPASVVGAQMDAAIEEIGIDSIKTGMLANVDIVHAVADRVERLGASCRLVLDPVVAASSGRSLLSSEGIEALWARLIPRAALVTPNLHEAKLLTGVTIRSREEMSQAADQFLLRGANAVLIKGGHLVEFEPELEEVSDLLRTLDGEELWIQRAREVGPPCRGTGCTLASAIAAGLAEGYTLSHAVERARDAVSRAFRSALPLGLAARPLGSVRELVH